MLWVTELDVIPRMMTVLPFFFFLVLRITQIKQPAVQSLQHDGLLLNHTYQKEGEQLQEITKAGEKCHHLTV